MTRGSRHKGLQQNAAHPLQTAPKPTSAGMTFPNPPTFSTKRTPFHPPGFELCHTPLRSAFGYTGDCEPGEAEPAPEGAAVAGQTLRAGCNGLPPVAGRWMVKTSDGLSQPRSQRPSGVPQGHTNKAPDLRETGLVTKTAGAGIANDPLPGRGSGRDVRTSAENLPGTRPGRLDETFRTRARLTTRRMFRRPKPPCQRDACNRQKSPNGAPEGAI